MWPTEGIPPQKYNSGSIIQWNSFIFLSQILGKEKLKY